LFLDDKKNGISDAHYHLSVALFVKLRERGIFAVKPDGVCNNGQTSASSVSQVGQNHAVMKVLQPNAMIETIEGQTESDCTHHAE
jgi:hypothetical protein